MFSVTRIQNMRMIDGKPEYKNGLVSPDHVTLPSLILAANLEDEKKDGSSLQHHPLARTLARSSALCVCPKTLCEADLFSFHAVHQEVLLRVVRSEGFFSLWKGFTPYYARLGPHTVLTFIFLEQMNRLYKTYVLDR